MPLNLTYAKGDAATITNTETSLVSGTTTLQTKTDKGAYSMIIDTVTNMAKGDEYKWRVYEKASTGATKRVILDGTVSDAQSQPVVTPPIALGLGFDFTFQRIAGTNRAFSWSIRRVST